MHLKHLVVDELVVATTNRVGLPAGEVLVAVWEAGLRFSEPGLLCLWPQPADMGHGLTNPLQSAVRFAQPCVCTRLTYVVDFVCGRSPTLWTGCRQPRVDPTEEVGRGS